MTTWMWRWITTKLIRKDPGRRRFEMEEFDCHLDASLKQGRARARRTVSFLISNHIVSSPHGEQVVSQLKMPRRTFAISSCAHGSGQELAKLSWKIRRVRRNEVGRGGSRIAATGKARALRFS
jgi:hypothetical protein